MIYGDRIRQARRIRRWKQTRLAELVGVTQSAISQFESGEKRPTDEVIERIAAETGFPVVFFERAPGPEIPAGSLAFRARRYASTLLDQDQAQGWAELVFECCLGLSRAVEQLPVAIPRLAGESPERAAQIARASLGLSPDRPIPNVTYTLERAGVIVLALPVGLAGRDAFSSWAGDAPPMPIVVVPKNNSEMVRFAVAHELKHLMDYVPRGYIKEVEQEADKFAAEFLMPANIIRDELAQAPLTTRSMTYLAQRWGVQRQSIVMRAVELEVISQRRGQQLFRMLNTVGELPELELSEKPRLLRRMAEIVYGTPPSAQALAADYGLPAQLAAAILGAHATRAEVVSAVPDDDGSNSKVVRFQPKS